MNRKIWKDFATPLAATHKVVTLDLPGLGKSPSKALPLTVQDVAHDVLEFLHRERLTNGVVIGHSLGGYVSLAMVGEAPELFQGLVLFHSTTRPDSEEKKQSRNKVIEFIEKNGVGPFMLTFVAPLFANANHPAIEQVKAICLEASEQAVIAYTAAMRDRPSTLDRLKQFQKPVLFIGGEKDGVVPPASINEQAAEIRFAEVAMLPDSAHMGMYENPKMALEKIHAFLVKLPVTNH